MKIDLHATDGRVLECREPYAGASHVEVPGHQCECSRDQTLTVQGGATTEGHDTISARAACTRCRGHVGTLIVTVTTMWGIEEDRRVLAGRARVY